MWLPPPSLVTAASFCAGFVLGRESWRRWCWLLAACACCALAAAGRGAPAAALCVGFALGRRLVVVGLTGGIAAGKSALSSALAARGVLVVDADAEARAAVAPGAPALAALVAAFGPAVLRPDGGLDRAWLRARIAGDARARAAVNAATHPAIARAIVAQVAAQRWLRGRAVVIDAALLFEAGLLYRLLCAPIVCVVAPDDVRAARVAARDGSAPELARALVAAQMPQADKAARSHAVVDNSGAQRALDAVADGLAANMLRGLWWS